MSKEEFFELLEILKDNQGTRQPYYIKDNVYYGILNRLVDVDINDKNAFAYALNSLVRNTNKKYSITINDFNQFKTIFYFCNGKNPDIFKDITILNPKVQDEFHFLFKNEIPTKPLVSGPSSRTQSIPSARTSSIPSARTSSIPSASMSSRSNIRPLNHRFQACSLSSIQPSFTNTNNSRKYDDIYHFINNNPNFIFYDDNEMKNESQSVHKQLLSQLKSPSIKENYENIIAPLSNCSSFTDLIIYLSMAMNIDMYTINTNLNTFLKYRNQNQFTIDEVKKKVIPYLQSQILKEEYKKYTKYKKTKKNMNKRSKLYKKKDFKSSRV